MSSRFYLFFVLNYSQSFFHSVPKPILISEHFVDQLGILSDRKKGYGGDSVMQCFLFFQWPLLVMGYNPTYELTQPRKVVLISLLC